MTELETSLDETLLWLCAIASPIGEERAQNPFVRG